MFLWKDERNPRKLPKIVARIAALSVIIAVVASSTVLANAYVNPESKIDLWVVIDGGTYGAVNLYVTMDDKSIATAHIDSDPVSRNTYYSLEINCTAGSHFLVVDAFSDTNPNINNRAEFYGEVRVLPFTTEFIQVGVGVGFI